MPTQPSLYGALTSRMDFLTARQGVIASNIANADTPGYLARDISQAKSNGAFGRALQQAQTNPMHMAAGAQKGAAAGKVSESSRFIQHNGNAVRIDTEMNKMNQVKLEYQLATQLYSKQVAMQKLAIGRGN